MSHLGYLARANSPLLYTETWPTFRTAATLGTGEFPSCLDTDPEFQQQPLQQC